MYSLPSLSLLSIVSLASAQLQLTSTGCVDPSGFDSCMNSATSQMQTCVTQNCNAQDSSGCESENNCYTADPNCVPACTCVAYQAWINCAVQSCWNRASTLTSYLSLSGALQADGQTGIFVRIPKSCHQRCARMRHHPQHQFSAILSATCQRTGCLLLSPRRSLL